MPSDHFSLPDGYVAVQVEAGDRTFHFAVKEEDAPEYLARMNAVRVDWDEEMKMDAIVISNPIGGKVAFDLETMSEGVYAKELLSGHDIHAQISEIIGPPDSPRNRLRDLAKGVGFSGFDNGTPVLLDYDQIEMSPPCEQFSSIGRPVELSQKYLDGMRFDKRPWSSPSCEHPKTPKPTKKEPTTWFGRTQREMRGKVSKRRAKNKRARKSRSKNREP